MINGIINVYKEKDFTSFDVVAVMRGISGTRKVGHTGTLDPGAEGVLPVCLGNATKLCDMLTDKKKEYVAVFMLGQRTDTLDASGTILETKKVEVTVEALTAAVRSFVGGYNQVPPMYSAKKIDGKKLYDLARQGVEVERKPVFVDIFDIEILDISLPCFTIRVECGKGTYIRSLGEDIGKACGELVTMTKLTRTRVSNFSIDEAYKLEELTKLKDAGKLCEAVLPTDRAFADLNEIHVKSSFRKLLDNGNKLPLEAADVDFSLKDNVKLRVYRDDSIFMGLYTYVASEKLYKPYKMFIGE